jgi:hypothetical protein
MTFEEIAPLFKKPTKKELTLYQLKKRIRIQMEDLTGTNKPESYKWFQVHDMLQRLLIDEKD